ncbi:MAG: hypothetical protein U1E65_22875 [Myxococcota bacterium]
MVQAISPSTVAAEERAILPLDEVLLERDGGWIFLSAWARVRLPVGVSFELACGNMVVSLDAASRVTKGRRRESAPIPVGDARELIVRARTAQGSIELSRGPVPRWVTVQPLSVLAGFMA